MTYFIADTHLGHTAIVGTCRRPFASVEEMDRTIKANWNAKVKRGDTVYILGDLIYKSGKDPATYLDGLNGKKVLILGNHDSGWLGRLDPAVYFRTVTPYLEITQSGHLTTLCHYPMLEWRNSRKVGTKKLGYLIHGHIHNRMDDRFAPLFAAGNALNAGVDINGYAPVTFKELMANNERFKLSTMSSRVEKATYLCRAYHMHATDKAGVPYAEHPIHVASEVADEDQKIVALLHDTLEDTPLSPALIEELFGETVLAAVRAMTHREGEDYFSYIERVRRDPLARAVKAADLRHNMDLSRLPTVTDADVSRRNKYERALALLQSPS